MPSFPAGFAAMAGLPAAFGLYSCAAAICGYTLVGSSKYLQVGPVALLCLLLSDGLVPLIPGSEENFNPNRPANPGAQQAYNRAAIQVSLLTGILFMLGAVCRLGSVTKLLTPPIISSFLTAGSIVIATSQVKYILGIRATKSSRLQDMLLSMGQHIKQVRWQECVMGASWLALLFSVRAVSKHSKRGWVAALGPILTAGFSMAAVWLLGLPQIDTVGHIRHGLPGFTVQWWWPIPAGHVFTLLKTAFLCLMVGLLEAIAIATALAEEKTDIKPSREILGLGLANLASAAFMGCPATGSFARSAVNKDAGAASGLATLFTSGVVIISLLFLTRAFELMPLNALAAIVIAGQQLD
eukprot:jgi/Astpho2/306/fgenesh1_pg.00010_%23_63_t